MKESLCVIDKKYFFHRGRLIIPIINFDKDLIFNVWTSISEENFRVRMDLWEDPNRVNNQPYFGWLQTNISTYGDTLNRKTLVFEDEIGLIPIVKLIEENHRLTTDQENGITFKSVKMIINEILKKEHQLE